jgi:hypothetical protein
MFEDIRYAEATPVHCGACLLAAMDGERSPDLSGSELIADDPNGLLGFAHCRACGAMEFIPLIAQGVEGYGIDLVHSIDRTGPVPVLVEVTR